MNILLNAPLPISDSSKLDYDNRILYYFLIMMAILVLVALMFVELLKSNISETPISTQESPSSAYLYV